MLTRRQLLTGAIGATLLSTASPALPKLRKQGSSVHMQHPGVALPPEMYLTLDDGWERVSQYTELIAQRGVATFFLLGPCIEEHYREIAQAIEQGFVVGCHGMTHTAASEQSVSSFEQELVAWRALVTRKLGEAVAQTSLFRFPYGDAGAHRYLEFSDALSRQGFQEVGWTTDLSTPYYFLPQALRARNAYARLNLLRHQPIVALAHFHQRDQAAIQAAVDFAIQTDVQMLALPPAFTLKMYG